VETYQCQKILLENFNKPSRELEEILKKEGILISYPTILKWKKKMTKEAVKLITGNKEYYRELAEQELDTLDNLVVAQKEIMSVMEKIKLDLEESELEDKPKLYGPLISAINTLMQRIALFMKKQGELHQRIEISKTENVNININQTMQEQILQWMEERGFFYKKETGELTLKAPELIDMFEKRKKKKVSVDG